MKKVCIITLYGNSNFGNKLQNYALQEYIKKLGDFSVETVREHNTDFKTVIKRWIKKIIDNKVTERTKLFLDFNKNINYTKKIYSRQNPKRLNNYDYYVVGSDQVWNPEFSGLSSLDLLSFTDSKNKISYAASFGVSSVSENYKDVINSNISKFKKISVREEAAKEILENALVLNDIDVVIDPTMLLDASEWERVMRKPKNFDGRKKYILNYFLGKLSDLKKSEIERVASENNCEIINILDPESPFYNCGPSEFLYLEKNAFLICTDSFHSSVFAILFNRPFIIFNRDDKVESMNSRIETLLSTFQIENRAFEGLISNENLKHNYDLAYKILAEKREESKKFLMEALDIGK